MKEDKKKVFLRTFGCKMNVRDSELVEGLFIKKGWKLAESQDKANLILFNTCSVRAHAEERVWGNINMLRKLKERRPGLIIGVIGCMAQRLKSDFFKKSNLVDIVCGPSDEEKLPELIDNFLKNRKKILSIDNIGKPRKEVINGRDAKFCVSTSGYVNISYGCNNFCSYCIVPYVRGEEISRKPQDIIREIKMLAKKGVKEIMLLGQNVNSYEYDFVKLLKKINDIDGIERIRFMTSHPKDANEKLFKAMAALPKVVKHLHLPLQSGSDKILKLMNRGYTAKRYISLVEKLRKIAPGCNITTDIIVGFPGETEADFKKTRDLMKKMKFAAAYIFKYSPRPPAVSNKMEDNVTKEEKERRHQELLKGMKKMGKNILFILPMTGALVLGCAHLVFANMEQAEVAFLKGDYGLAVQNCDDSAAGYYLKGRTMLKENDIQGARAIFEKILVDFIASGFDDAAQLGLADTYFSDEKYEQAIGEYSKILEKYSQSRFAAIALYKLGRTCLKLNQMEQARAYFQKLEQDYPLSFEAKLIDELDNSEFANSVQVGCFSGYGNAEKLVGKLKNKGFDAYISEKEGRPVFYRVRVGKFKTVSEAMDCKISLEKKGYKTKLCP